MSRTLEEIKAEFEQDVANPQPLDGRLFGATIGVLNKACEGYIQDRYRLQMVLVGVKHSDEMSQAQKYALTRFVRPAKMPDAGWDSSRGAEFYEDVKTILAYQDPVDPQQEPLF